MVWPRTVEGQPGKARRRGGADGSNRRIRGRADRMLNKEHRSMRVVRVIALGPS